MNRRLETNTNLILHTEDTFGHYRVNTNYGPLVQNYLQKVDTVIQTAIASNSKTLVIGLCLKIPINMTSISDRLISAFFSSFKAKLCHHYKMTLKRHGRAHRADLRYIWAKERNESENDHYHVMLFLNGHAYHTTGSITADHGNLSARLVQAWASALNIYQSDVEGCVHVTGEKMINRGDWQALDDLFFWASYCCKADTKHYGDSGRSFGCSQR